MKSVTHHTSSSSTKVKGISRGKWQLLFRNNCKGCYQCYRY